MNNIKSISILPKVNESFRIGNRGEAYLEFIMSKHCLMHKIAGYKDIGIDYLCEWLVGNSPTRILFGIQVKTSDKDIELRYLGRNKGLNGLEKYKFKNKPSWKIEQNTINYWFGFEIPLYLFFVLRNGKERFNCYYQRLTPALHKKNQEKAIEEIKNYMDNDLYQGNDNVGEFRAIIERNGKDGGFARDLFFDSIRCSYFTGSIRYRECSEFGLKGWEGQGIYADILGLPECNYLEKVEESLQTLKDSNIVTVNPEWQERIKELCEKSHKR
jgi:hypothetical protein